MVNVNIPLEKNYAQQEQAMSKLNDNKDDLLKQLTRTKLWVFLTFLGTVSGVITALANLLPTGNRIALIFLWLLVCLRGALFVFSNEFP